MINNRRCNLFKICEQTQDYRWWPHRRSRYRDEQVRIIDRICPFIARIRFTSSSRSHQAHTHNSRISLVRRNLLPFNINIATLCRHLTNNIRSLSISFLHSHNFSQHSCCNHRTNSLKSSRMDTNSKRLVINRFSLLNFIPRSSKTTKLLKHR